jgi:cytochrome d ubiquinol oxidase subunit II
VIPLWFAAAALPLAVYVVLAGADFGAGALDRSVARDERERRQLLAALGPLWTGHTLWLLAAGGVLLLAFPGVLAAGLSGFWRALALLAAGLLVRTVARLFRLRSGAEGGPRLWDAVFAGASMLAPLLLGTLLGNVLRGVPLDRSGRFALPLFQGLSPRGELGLLDEYTLLIGVVALVALTHHGALLLAWRTDRRVRRRSLLWAARLFPATVVSWVAATAATAHVSPNVFLGVERKPLVWLASALLVGGLVTSFAGRRMGRDLAAFLGSSAFLLGTLGAIVASVYPTWLAASFDPDLSLTALDAASRSEALGLGRSWWLVGPLLALPSVATIFWLRRGRARAAEQGERP